MTNDTTYLLRLFAAVATVLVALTAALFALTLAPAAAPLASDVELWGDDGDEQLGFDGNAGRVPDSRKPRITAYFTRESYRPGDAARLVVVDATGATLQFRRAGGEPKVTHAHDVMLGTPIGLPRTLVGRGEHTLRIGDWPSGVYFAELTAGARTGYAPFVLAPRALGAHRVAVVMPTMTWQAYNWRDDDRDGVGDTWYANWDHQQARLIRPFLNRGVPPHWAQYDAPFVHWLTETKRNVDYLSDAELRNADSGRALAAAYDLIVFSGHHEYVTTREYDVVTRYRDAGGDLMFLSANNFFWRVDLHGTVMTRVAKWRDLGRPEAALIGVQYRANDDGRHTAGWLIRRAEAAPWLFAGVDVENGDRLAKAGIEIDSTAPSSPCGVRVLAEIPNLYGPGFTAQMTYYESAAGARVFAAGAFTLAGSVENPQIERLLVNLWNRLAA